MYKLALIFLSDMVHYMDLSTGVQTNGMSDNVCHSLSSLIGQGRDPYGVIKFCLISFVDLWTRTKIYHPFHGFPTDGDHLRGMIAELKNANIQKIFMRQLFPNIKNGEVGHGTVSYLLQERHLNQ